MLFGTITGQTTKKIAKFPSIFDAAYPHGEIGGLVLLCSTKYLTYCP